MKKTLLALCLLTALTAAAATPRKTVRIDISGGFYNPKEVKVKKGQPIRLQFVRDAKPTCGDSLVIPSLKVKQQLEVGKPFYVNVTPTKDIAFGCGMDMMRGKIVVQ
jgi:plastocyanin domain-containing protein